MADCKLSSSMKIGTVIAGLGAALGLVWWRKSVKPSPSVSAREVVQHIVLFKWKETASAATIAAIIDGLKKLPETNPSIVALTYGEAFNDRNQGFTHAITVTFASKADLKAYGTEPTHSSLVKGSILPNAESVIAVDYVTPVIVGADHA